MDILLKCFINIFEDAFTLGDFSFEMFNGHSWEKASISVTLLSDPDEFHVYCTRYLYGNKILLKLKKGNCNTYCAASFRNFISSGKFNRSGFFSSAC